MIFFQGVPCYKTGLFPVEGRHLEHHLSWAVQIPPIVAAFMVTTVRFPLFNIFQLFDFLPPVDACGMIKHSTCDSTLSMLSGKIDIITIVAYSNNVP
jgi:hypothetical protein